jgi:outer membrane protein assembly factor BamB
MMAMLAWCAVAYGEWPTYHGDSGLRGVSDAQLPDALELVWRSEAGAAVYNTPVSDGERIFFSAKKGQVIALDLQGSLVWKRSFTRSNDAGETVPARFEAPLACAGGMVLAATARGTLHALDGKTGQVRWSYASGGTLLGSPNGMQYTNARPSGLVIVLDQSEGSLHGLRLNDGKRMWKTEGVERCDGSPGIGDGTAVFGSCLAALHVYSTEGTHLKDIEVGGDGQIAGGVAVDGKLAFAGTRDGSLVCADLEVGDIVWSSDESEDQSFSTPAVTGGRVVYTSDNGFVYAVGRKEGKLLWQFDTGGIPTSPVIAGGKVVLSADGILYLLNLKDGRMVWSKEISDEITSPALVGGLIVTGADDGTVTAWGAK